MADYKLQPLEISDVSGIEFSLEEYIQVNKFSGQVRLYLTSEVEPILEKSSDGDPKDTSCAFESDSDGDDLLPVLKETEPAENLEERRKIRREQDQAYQESLKCDKEKEEAQKRKLANELLDTQRQESTRHSRELRVPREPDVAEEHCTVSIRHTYLGLCTRRFVPSNTVAAVYDWIGSLSLVPENFELLFKPGNVISPTEPVTVINKITINMSPSQRTFSIATSRDIALSFQELVRMSMTVTTRHLGGSLVTVTC